MPQPAIILTVAYLSPQWSLTIMSFLLIGSGLFSGTETALFSPSRRDMKDLEDSWSGRLVLKVLTRPQPVLTSLLFANTLINVAFSGFAARLVLECQADGYSAWIIVVITIGPLLGLILAGEVAPKMLAYGSACSWAKVVIVPIVCIIKLLQPIVQLVDLLIIKPLGKLIVPQAQRNKQLSSDQLALLLKSTAQRMPENSGTSELLHEIVELASLRVCDIMVPRVDMITCPSDAVGHDLVELFKHTGIRTLLVQDNDQIIGQVGARPILINPNSDVSQYIKPVFFIPELATLDNAMEQFKIHKSKIAIAVDEYGSTAGLITFANIVEQVVGELHDSHIPNAPPLIQTFKDYHLVHGSLPIHEWVGIFDLNKISDKRVHTLSGLVALILGRMAKPGDTVQWQNLHMRIESTHKHRADVIKLKIMEPQA